MAMVALGEWVTEVGGDGVPRVVVDVRADGTIVLQDRHGKTARSESKCVLPCAARDKWIFPVEQPGVESACEECDRAGVGAMVVCDHCATTWHIGCTSLSKDAAGCNKNDPWFCRYCNVLSRRVRQECTPTAPAPAPSADGMLQRLHREMPGSWTQAHATKLHNEMRKEKDKCEYQRVSTRPEEMVCLLQSVRFERFDTVLDPWCGTGTIAKQLKSWSVGARLVSSDLDEAVVADEHGDALDRSFMRDIVGKYGCIDAVVTSPRFEYLDLALPVLVETARLAVLCHVPTSYLFNPNDGRQRWLATLAEEGRMHVIIINCRANTNWRCAWLCIFKNAHWKKILLREEVPTATFSIGMF